MQAFTIEKAGGKQTQESMMEGIKTTEPKATTKTIADAE
jgi:hypothetical protein